MREMIQVFNGNEISLGILLATWLLWTAIGSGLASIAGIGRRQTAAAGCCARMRAGPELAGGHLGLARREIFFPDRARRTGGATAYAANLPRVPERVLRGIGGAFVAAARLAAAEGGVSSHVAASMAYLLEAAGAGLGGILGSVVLVRFFESFQIAAMVGLLEPLPGGGACCCGCGASCGNVGGAVTLASVPLLAWVAPQWDRAAEARLWRGFNVVGERNSIYGNLTVTQTGIPSDRSSSMGWKTDAIDGKRRDPFHLGERRDSGQRARSGRGRGGGGLCPARTRRTAAGLSDRRRRERRVAEALQHPTIERLDYVELDPALIGMARQFFPAQTAAFDSGPRVRLHFLDGRRYLAESNEKFDVIIVDVPDPQTAQLNRFYTAEFFGMARAHLSPSGLLALELRSAEEAISPDLADFLRWIRNTLGEVFPVSGRAYSVCSAGNRPDPG